MTGNITTGPQDGSPISPRELILSKSVASVDMNWMNGPSGKGPILGYYFESKKRGKFIILEKLHSDFSKTEIFHKNFS